jgi:DNA-binding NtrC family response regulator
MICKVLVEVDGNKTKAAARLKISRRTLYNKLSEHDLA